MLTLITLAAGKSTRMRGINKLLAKVDGVPMIRHVVKAALSSKVDEVVVVLGYDADKVREAIADLPCRLVINRDYEQGQSSSLITGMREVQKRTRAVLVVPGDLAKIDSASINLVADAYIQHGGRIVCAAHNGKLGHPILLSRELFDEIMQITEEKSGLKSVVMNHQREIKLVEANTENVLMDIDSPDELKRLGS